MDPLVPLSPILLSDVTPNFGLIPVIVFLIIFGAFFSGVETALTCCNRARMKTKAEDGNKSAKLVLKLLEKHDQSLITILIGNNILRIASAVCASILMTSFLPNDTAIADAIATVSMTLIVFLFGETIPKNFCKANADKMSLIMCYLLFVVYILTYPLMQIFNFLLFLVKKIFRIKVEETALSEDEFQDLVEVVEDEGGIDTEESDIIQAAVDFNDITVKTVMTKKENIVFLDYKKLSKEQIIKNLEYIKYTRVPVYKDNINNIIGIFNLRKFLKVTMTSKKLPIKQSMSEVIKVKDDTLLDEMVELFKSKKSHMAIVFNDEENLVGLVTMEDVLEELVGESRKEKIGGKQ